MKQDMRASLTIISNFHSLERNFTKRTKTTALVSFISACPVLFWLSPGVNDLIF